MKRSIRKTLLLLCLTTRMVVLPAVAMERSPDEWLAKAYYNRGTGFYGKADYEAAVNDLSMAITLEPKAPDAYFNRGLSYRRQHRIDEAISDFSKAIQLYAAQPGYYFERCNALIVKNDLNGAVVDCSEGLRLSPDDASGYLMRGVAHLLRGDLDEALTDSVEALQIDPSYKDARRLLFETLLAKEGVDQRAHSRASHKSALENLPRGVFGVEKT